MVDFCTVTVGVVGVGAAGVSSAGAATAVPSVIDVAGVVALSVEGVVVVADSGSASVSVGAATAGSARLAVDVRTDTVEPPLESGADCLLVERLRAGPAFLGPWLELDE
jgi:hypothetical protein